MPQFTLLYVLNKGPLIQSMVAELLAVDRTTLTRTLGTMERSGLIRSSTGDDKRVGADRWEVLINELTIIAAAARWRLSDGVERYRVKRTPAPRL